MSSCPRFFSSPKVPDVNYSATFTPVIKPATVRLLIALACVNNWEIDTFNAKWVFLLGTLKKEIYMHQPKCFEDSDWCTIVWLMLQTIYGLKQSALEWYKQVWSIMPDLGFIHSSSNHALFYYNEMDVAATVVRIHCLISWHVNDWMAVSNCHPFLQKVKQRIAEWFRPKDLGPLAKYLGVQFEHDWQSCKTWMHQSKYIAFLLQEYNLLDCNPIHLPANPKLPSVTLITHTQRSPTFTPLIWNSLGNSSICQWTLIQTLLTLSMLWLSMVQTWSLSLHSWQTCSSLSDWNHSSQGPVHCQE